MFIRINPGFTVYLLSFREVNKVTRDSYIMVTPPPKVKEGQALKEPQGISSPFWKEAFSRPSLTNQKVFVQMLLPPTVNHVIKNPK